MILPIVQCAYYVYMYYVCTGAPNMGGHQGHVPPQNSGLYRVKISKFCKISFFIIVVPPNIRGSLAPLEMLYNINSLDSSDGRVIGFHPQG